MGVNTEFAGREYPPTAPHEVTAQEISAFAASVWAENPVHHDAAAAQAAGYADVIAPPTFAVGIAQRSDVRYIFDPESGIDFSRVVHGEQAFTHHRPIVAGDRIVAVLHVDRIREAGGHAMVTTRSELATEAGEPVSTAVSTIVVRGEG